ncbi:MAG: cell wall hydrolase [Novosphingobium sp.]
MSPKLQRASAIAVAATVLTTLFSAAGSGAGAQEKIPVAVESEPTPDSTAPDFTAQAVVQPLPQAPIASSALADAEQPQADTLPDLVAVQEHPEELSRELDCLAGAIYFEAKSETLAGQLAVGRVVVARSKSGRFPNSYCGVVYQPSQFSFVRGNSMPAINRSSRTWKTAVAVAQIAHEGSWRSPVEGALFFHATHVAPRWRLTRMARVDNHVFYR